MIQVFSSSFWQRFFIASILIWLSVSTLGAQLSQHGTPPALQEGVRLRSLPSAQMPSLATPYLLAGKPFVGADKLRPQGALRALVYPSVVYEMDSIDASQWGEWYSSSTGQWVWRGKLSLPEADAVSLYFNYFHLAPNQQLYVFTPHGETVLGAFTEQNNTSYQDLTLAPIVGNELWVEFVSPVYTSQLPWQLHHVTAIQADHLRANEPSVRIDGLTCAPNVINHAEQWGNEMRSTLLIIARGGTTFSGALINNTAKDGKAYVLTASHCLNDLFRRPNDKDYRDQTARECVFFFNYWSPVGNQYFRGLQEQTLSGAKIVAWDESRDLCLLEITGVLPQPTVGECAIPPAYMPYFSGWDASLQSQGPFVGLHYPYTSVQRYSYAKYPDLQIDNYNAGVVSWQDSHWKLPSWTIGTTAPASSGSPLYNKEHKIIGALSGGGSYCPPRASSEDYYYALAKCWKQQGKQEDEQLHGFLDPKQTQATSLDGLDPFAPLQPLRLSHLLYHPYRDSIEPGQMEQQQLQGVAAAYPIRSASKLLGVIPVVAAMELWPECELLLWRVSAKGESAELYRSIIEQPQYERFQQGSATHSNRTITDPMQFFVDLTDKEYTLNTGDTLFIAIKSTDQTPLALPILENNKNLGIANLMRQLPVGSGQWQSIPHTAQNQQAYWIDALLLPLEEVSHKGYMPEPVPYFIKDQHSLVLVLPSSVDPQSASLALVCYDASGVPVAHIPVTQSVQHFYLPAILTEKGVYVAVLWGYPKRIATKVLYENP